MLKQKIERVYAERRKKLIALEPEACFIFFGASEVVRSNDVHYSFRQNSDFFYLTEFEEADAILVLVSGKSHLFVQKRDEQREVWTGELYGQERAKSVFGVDETHATEEFDSKLDELLVDATKVYVTLGSNLLRDHQLLKNIHQASRFQGKGSFGHLPILDPTPLLAELRSVKDEYEQSLLRKACSATAKAHLQILKRARAGMTEFDLQNEFQYHVFKNGCTDLGYGPIFASGFNATTLHYVRNNDTLKLGDLILIDAAGEVNSYTSDLTQTFPVAGTFSLDQKRVYEKVLSVNREITQMVKPGVNYRELHTHSVTMITDALLSLGVLEGDLQSNIKASNFRKYYPHGLGHYLGLDVHDVGFYHERGHDFELKAGMVLTNEPGLYFRERGTPFYGTGVRIEDDLLVTASGVEVLTHELPRDVDAIQNFRTIANS